MNQLAQLTVKGSLWAHVHATQGPCGRFHVVVNLYGPAWGFSEWTDPLRLRRLNGRLQFLGGALKALAVDARRVRKDLALRERGTIISPLEMLIQQGEAWCSRFLRERHRKTAQRKRKT